MIKQYRMWLLRQQRRRAQKRNEEVCASLSVRLIDGSLYIAYGCTLIHKFSIDNLSDDERKIFLSYIAANYPDSIQFIKE